MFQNLTDRQKKIMLAVAAAAGLALIALLGRGRGTPAEAPAEDVTVAGSGGAPPFGTTFADNGEAAAGLSTAITEGLGDVGAALEGVTASQFALGEQLAGQDPLTADAIAAATAAVLADRGMTATPAGPAATHTAGQAKKGKAMSKADVWKSIATGRPVKPGTTKASAGVWKRRAQRLDRNPRKPGVQTKPPAKARARAAAPAAAARPSQAPARHAPPPKKPAARRRR